MKKSIPKWLEKHRVKEGALQSPSEYPSGAFILERNGHRLAIIVSHADEDLWEAKEFPLPMFEHVSVSLEDRCPTWDEMNYAKKLFWDKEELVLQYHPPASLYVNCHPFCLHLWKPVGIEIPIPPSFLIA